MSLDSDRYPFLYSTGTLLSYRIAKKYYNDTHYVWCTTKFNSKLQPPTSNPLTICRRYLEQSVTSDRHSHEIEQNKAGILKGAKIKYDNNIITKKQYIEIRSIVNSSEYKDFLPVIYIINSSKIKHKCKEIETEKKASDSSVEFIIEDLKYDEFEIIKIKDIIDSIINVSDKRAGE